MQKMALLLKTRQGTQKDDHLFFNGKGNLLKINKHTSLDGEEKEMGEKKTNMKKSEREKLRTDSESIKVFTETSIESHQDKTRKERRKRKWWEKDKKEEKKE
jgi:hypothetical protein